jgi:hypothetical protein
MKIFLVHSRLCICVKLLAKLNKKSIAFLQEANVGSRKSVGLEVSPESLSSAEPYEFLVKLRNITWETNYVIVSQNALGMMGRRKLRKASELNLFTWNDNIQSFGS